MTRRPLTKNHVQAPRSCPFPPTKMPFKFLLPPSHGIGDSLYRTGRKDGLNSSLLSSVKFKLRFTMGYGSEKVGNNLDFATDITF